MNEIPNDTNSKHDTPLIEEGTIGYLTKRRFYWAVILLVCSTIGYIGILNSLSDTAEQDALDIVRAHGFTAEGYKHTAYSPLLQWLPTRAGKRPWGTTPSITVAIPRNLMTDGMAETISHIRGLETIMLYPASFGRVSFDATVTTEVPSLLGLKLPISEGHIAKLEKQFPALQIFLKDVPASGGSTTGTPAVTQ